MTATLTDAFTSTGHKFFAHPEAMEGLRDGKPKVVVTHLMLTDSCQHSCSFCSVHHREGNSLHFGDVMAYLDILQRHGLRATILSGGGNPILYRCRESGKDFNDVVDAIHARGLEIGVITNGAPMREYMYVEPRRVEMSLAEIDRLPPEAPLGIIRKSWKTVRPETLDKCTWIRISMAGLDHDEREVYVPDIDPSKTTLGFSYVAADVWDAPEDKAHGKVSTERDVLALGALEGRKVWRFEERVPELVEQFVDYVKRYNPVHFRILPNCLEPHLIERRCEQLAKMARVVNFEVDREVCFVQNKPPAPPPACYLGYLHPVLNSDGYVLPCDSCCLNESSGHKLGEPWRICHWSEIGKIYEQPVRSLIADTKALCPGCVFTKSNVMLGKVIDGSLPIVSPSEVPVHHNFI